MTLRAATLQELAQAASGQVDRSGDVSITGLAYHSDQVQAGDLFFCVPGLNHDGHDFAVEALGRGAAGLVVDHRLDVDCAQIQTPSVREAMGPISALFYGHPSRQMPVVGITGTNGKTTVVSLLKSVLDTAGYSPEVIGTLTGALTTPESVDLQRLLECWRLAGTDVVVMEVSSHALHQHRVDGTRFAVSVFTNLTQDHLDYHRTAEEYFNAKARLFTSELTTRAVVNQADDHGAVLAADPLVPTVVYDPTAAPVRVTAGGLSVRWRGEDVELPLAGRFNVANVLAAAEAALLLGVDVAAVREGLKTASPVPGRFEVIQTGESFTVIVDYAHTPDGLSKTLIAARDLVTGGGGVRVVFGCGGDRDPGKRPRMGQVAAELADQVVVTSDNPRWEDPEAIIAQILDGISSGRDQVLVHPERREAIAQALTGSAPGDVVVVAGKGHETTQTVNGQEIPFNDREVVGELLGGQAGEQAGGGQGPG